MKSTAEFSASVARRSGIGIARSTGTSERATMTSSERLNIRQYAQRSLRFHWQVNLAVMLGIIVGTAVLTGALIVGDSVRYSLQRLTLERLGRIDEVLLADHFFSVDLVKDLRLPADPLDGFTEAVPAILLPQTTLEKSGADTPRRVGQVTLVGANADFWALSDGGPKPRAMPKPGQIILNQALADDVHAAVGDHVIVRLPKATRIAGDSPLGEKVDRVQSLAELEVIEIIPSVGLGRFSLRANQALPRTAFLDLQLLQQTLEQPGRVNAGLIAGPVAERAPNETQILALRTRIRPTLEDAGLRLKSISLDYWPANATAASSVLTYLSLSTETMMFSPSAEAALKKALAGLEYESVLTYLANSISAPIHGDSTARAIPYSTVSAISDSPLSPLVDVARPDFSLADDEIVLNQWAADDLKVEPGDTIRLDFFAPETTHGEAVEKSHAFTLKAVVDLPTPETPFRRGRAARYAVPPTRANDPDLTPEVPGITDQESIDDWDPPFPFDYSRIRKPEDEDYWDHFRTTPKAFVSLQTGQTLWGSRFGQTTSFRIGVSPSLGDGAAAEAEVRRRVASTIADDPAAFGIALLHVKADGLRASQGTTPFNALFLGFSFFIIAAALMLVSLLFRLSLERRARETGLLLSLGLNQRQVSKLFLSEGFVLTLLGTLLGTVSGIGYAALMISGLRTWWLDAVVTPFLELHVGRISLPLGALIGGLTSLLTILFTLAGLRRISLRNLLAQNIEPNASSRRQRRTSVYVAMSLWILALMAAIAAVFLRGEAQAGAFFSAGASVLIALLLQVSWWLRRPMAVKNLRRHGFSLRQLVVRNLGRNSRRSILTLGLVAMACFLIVAISAFRLRPTEQGTGGFPLIAQTDVSIFEDLNDPDVRQDLLGAQTESLSDTTTYAFRLREGDDASCRNLYQAQQPRILGVTPQFIQHFDAAKGPRFGWAGSLTSEGQSQANPWHLLTRTTSDAIPVVLDKNTAMYSLHLYGGVGQEFELDYGSNGKLRFRVVGLLANSVLQGSLLISEASLVRHFPEVSGYRYFLIDTPKGREERVREVLENAFRDQGLQTIETERLLADLLAVQNTYLSTFQSLGGLGLLLGTFGLVAVQLRNVFERCAELALLRATGFSRNRLGRLVLLEHLTLLLGGLGIGLIAALVAVIPHAWTTEIRPPWGTLFGVLVTILSIGMVTGYLALRPVIRAPLMGVLRSE